MYEEPKKKEKSGTVSKVAPRYKASKVASRQLKTDASTNAKTSQESPSDKLKADERLLFGSAADLAGPGQHQHDPTVASMVASTRFALFGREGAACSCGTRLFDATTTRCRRLPAGALAHRSGGLLEGTALGAIGAWAGCRPLRLSHPDPRGGGCSEVRTSEAQAGRPSSRPRGGRGPASVQPPARAAGGTGKSACVLDQVPRLWRSVAACAQAQVCRGGRDSAQGSCRSSGGGSAERGRADES